MNLHEFIFKRKSVRKYDEAPLDPETIGKILAFAQKLKPLYPEIKTSFEMIDSVKGLFSIKAPHYFLICSESRGDYLENAGYMWQQMDLYLSSLGLGSCWLGMAKPAAEIQTALPLVITLAFGRAAEAPHRELAGFKRKSPEEISSGSDSRIEAARLAPSATNSQNWFFEASEGMIHVYRKKLNPALEMMYGKMNRIDAGIALCHLRYATEQEEREFRFEKHNDRMKKGYVYVGTVSL